MDQLPRLGKRELIYLLLFTCNYSVSDGEVSSSSGCLGWATLFVVALPEPSIQLFKLQLSRLYFLFEPRREKTGFLHMRKQRRRSASR